LLLKTTAKVTRLLPEWSVVRGSPRAQMMDRLLKLKSQRTRL